ncbi:hypothetical protein BU15DRAFT_55021 [Melanogaster broomeanus]|nr:hypothetical protein BU15DRAFT_55021 [Melanogaster broomeanus]
MPPDTINPHNVEAPNYASERFRAARQPLVDDFHITHEQAAQRLTAIWEAQNALDREEWNLQQEELAEAARLEQEQRLRQEEGRQRAADEEQELAKQEERKNNRNKFLPYNKKGDYVELYYFTNKGLAEAEASSRLTDDDAFALMRNENGHHSFIPIAAAKVKDSIIPDKDLTWVEFDEAAPRLLQAMRENGWDEERVNSHLQMWMALSAHEYRHDADEFSKRALIVYHDIARRRWHLLLGMPQSFDLVPIDRGMIKEIRDDLLHKANKALRDEAIQVSQIIIPTMTTAHIFMQTPLPLHHNTSASRLSPGTTKHSRAGHYLVAPLSVPVPAYGNLNLASRRTLDSSSLM